MRIFAKIMGNHGIDGREIIARRTVDSKTFDLGNGKRKLVKCLCPLHFEASPGVWIDIDLSPRDDGDDWVIDQAPYILRISKRRPFAIYESRATGRRARIRHPGAGGPEFIGDEAIWRIGPDKDISLDIRPAKVIVSTLLHSDRADPESYWDVSGYSKECVGHDANRDPAEVIDRRFTGRVSRMVDKVTRRREWCTDPAWPVRIV